MPVQQQIQRPRRPVLTMLVTCAFLPLCEMKADHLFFSLTASIGVLLIYWLFGPTLYSKENTMANISHKYKYEAVTGYFLQDDPKTDPDSFEYARYSSLF
jgi:hypothetical protein